MGADLPTATMDRALGERLLGLLVRTRVADRVAVEVAGALRRHGIHTILLKGPAVAAWLYDDIHARAYVDSDLLVDPARIAAAEAILAELGFVSVNTGRIPSERTGHAMPWIRVGDGGNVDLHRTLPEVAAPPALVWQVLERHQRRLALADGEVCVLDEGAQAFVLVVHTLHHVVEAEGIERPVAELTRALARIPEPVWRAAAEVAGELGASGTLGAGLGVVPAGRQLASRFGLAGDRGIALRIALAAEPAPPLAKGLARVAARRGIWAQLVVLGRKAFPPPHQVRLWRSWAARSPVALVVAYPWRWIWLARQLPAARAALRRAAARSDRPSE